MRTTALLLPLIIPGLSSALHAQQQRSADRPQAEPLSNTRWHRALSYHRDQLSVRRADLCFVGDSLTECWSQEGSAAWRELTRGWQAVNCGISGDRTEHILFRLDKINLAKRGHA